MTFQTASIAETPALNFLFQKSFRVFQLKLFIFEGYKNMSQGVRDTPVVLGQFAKIDLMQEKDQLEVAQNVLKQWSSLRQFPVVDTRGQGHMTVPQC